MNPVFSLLVLPFLCCLILTGIHAYLGLHVVERGVIFVDLSLAQVAALGTTIAFLAGHDLHSQASYFYSLGFTLIGALLFSITRFEKKRIPQEAFIGIVYAVCAAASILIVDRAPEGAEHIKYILVGNLLAVTPHEVIKMAALYSCVGVIHWIWRKPILAVSLSSQKAEESGRPSIGEEVPLQCRDKVSGLSSISEEVPLQCRDKVSGLSVRFWDFVFYGTFGFVVTSSVAIAGVLLVFSFLIVPSVIAMLFSEKVGVRLLIGWVLGTVVSLLGMVASYKFDTPTGATVVVLFGVSLIAALLAQKILRTNSKV